MNRDRILALVDDYLECALTEADQEELEKIVLDSADARRLFWAYIQQHTLIHKIESENGGRVQARLESADAGNIPRGRRLGWGIRAACLLLLSLWTVWYCWPRRLEQAGFILLSGSEVTIVREHEELPGHAGMLLRWGDRAITRDGSALIRTSDKIHLELGPETTVVLTGPSGEGQIFHLASGTVTTDFDKAVQVDIDTPNARVTDLAGAGHWSIVAQADSTRVDVIKGSCSLKRKSDQWCAEISTDHFAIASPTSLMIPQPLNGTDSDAGSPARLATWCGGPQSDSIDGIAIAPDGTVLIGGTMPGADLASWKPDRETGAGDGFILRLSPDGRRVDSLVRRIGSIDDVRLDALGNAYLIGSGGCAKLNASLQAEWTLDLKSNNGRIAPGPEGRAVILTGERLTVVDDHGKIQTQWSIPNRTLRDLVCDPVSKVLYITGSSIPAKNEGEIPFVYAFDLAGKKLWSAYDWTTQQVQAAKLTAGSVGVRLVLDKNGQLYLAGESHGGNTVWGRQSVDIKETVPGPTQIDRFQNPFNIRGQFLTFVAHLDTRTGRVLQSTVLLGRSEMQRGSSMRPLALAVDAEERIYVGGWAGATPPVTRGAFGLRGEGEGAFLCVFDHDFRRLYSARLCGGTATAIATGANTIAVAGRARDGLRIVAPFQADPGGEDDGWFILFRKTAGNNYESPIPEQPRP